MAEQQLQIVPERWREWYFNPSSFGVDPAVLRRAIEEVAALECSNAELVEALRVALGIITLAIQGIIPTFQIRSFEPKARAAIERATGGRG